MVLPVDVTLPTDAGNTGKNIDNVQLTNENSVVVLRQGVFLGDPSAAANRASVDSSGRLNTGAPNVTITTTNQNVGTSSTQLLAANTAAKYRYFYNGGSSISWLMIGGAAALGTGLPISPNGSYEMSPQNGNMDQRVVNAISVGGTDAFCVMEGV